MDSRVPDLVDAIKIALAEKAEHIRKAQAIFVMNPPERLRPVDIAIAYDHVTADLPSPLRATLVDLGRVLNGDPDHDSVRMPTPHQLRIFSPTG